MPPKQEQAAPEGSAGQPAAEEDPSLLQAVLSRDLPALQAALGGPSPPLVFRTVSALHVAALADWGEGVALLLAAAGERSRRTRMMQNSRVPPTSPIF